ncbi:uncharacterized protein LY89DRAFT_667431 [Mollisia scopiformis]|uniref:Uncharacterized protein n=1 Tax=Mollisia scopiformis TaxID=149040 RepID=A0A194XH42_MOLSC|nr:uncharacterized protein LY89DRAFT_667431 [Mollisia scopiformis]KUJ19483.1 hypothetical protein LY89DRAFT_667431 [Mollisia scopiformis]
MNTDQSKEDKLLNDMVPPPDPLHTVPRVLDDALTGKLMEHYGLSRIPEISSAFTRYFEAHEYHDRRRAVRSFIAGRSNPQPLEREQEVEDGFEERGVEKQALESLIPMLKAFLVEVNKDIQPYLSEDGVFELWTLVEECRIAMEDGDVWSCYGIVAKIHKGLTIGRCDRELVFNAYGEALSGRDISLGKGLSGPDCRAEIMAVVDHGDCELWQLWIMAVVDCIWIRHPTPSDRVMIQQQSAEEYSLGCGDLLPEINTTTGYSPFLDDPLPHFAGAFRRYFFAHNHVAQFNSLDCDKTEEFKYLYELLTLFEALQSEVQAGGGRFCNDSGITLQSLMDRCTAKKRIGDDSACFRVAEALQAWLVAELHSRKDNCTGDMQMWLRYEELIGSLESVQ